MRLKPFHTWRLVAVYAIAFAISITLMGGIVLATTTNVVRALITKHAQADIAAVREGYANLGLGEAREVTQQRMAAAITTDFIVLQQDGRKLEGNLPAMTETLGVREISLPALPGHSILGVGARLTPRLYIFSGTDLAFLREMRTDIINQFLWLSGAALLTVIMGSILISRGFLSGIEAIANTCRAIMAGDMADRVPLRGRERELDQLAATINAMLDRIAALMENVQQVSSDIAHDLRTPLTHLRQRLEKARSEASDPQQYDAALDRAIAATDEILSLFTALLRLAQIEGGARRAGFAAVDMADVLQKAAEVFGAVAEDSGHVLAVRPGPPCWVRGDRELLFQLLTNLIENGIVHTPSGTAITVSLKREADRAILIVRDDGPGIPAEASDKVLRRLYRLDPSRTRPGHGLGLALVSAITELHGGQIRLTQADGGGLLVDINLPLDGKS